MLQAITWRTQLGKEEQDAYKEMFFKWQTQNLSLDPTLLAVIRKDTDAELEKAFHDPSAKFLSIERMPDNSVYNSVFGMLSLTTLAIITVYERPKYLAVRHFASRGTYGDGLAKKILVNVQLEYPDRPFYGICQKADTGSCQFYRQVLGADIGKYFLPLEHPEKKAEDGWVGVSTGVIEV